MNFTVSIDRAFELLHDSSRIQGSTLKNLLLTKLQAAQVIQEREDCGKQVKELAENNGLDLAVLCAYVLGRRDSHLENLLGLITIKAADEDNPCPDCGCELEVHDEAADGFYWEEIKCNNCPYETSTEPDWDILPGGHACEL